MALSPWTSGPWWQQPQEDPNRWWQTPVSPITSALSPSKSAAEETADLLKRYREALAGSTSEAPADVMKDARKAGLAQSLIALGAGIAHGDWTGGIQAGSQALTQGYDQTIQRWAKTRDQNFEKQQAELQMALKEAELRTQATEDRRRDDEEDRLRRKYADNPDLAGAPVATLRAYDANRMQSQAGYDTKLANESAGWAPYGGQIPTADGGYAQRWRNKFTGETELRRGEEVIEESDLAKQTTPEEKRQLDLERLGLAKASAGRSQEAAERAAALMPGKLQSQQDLLDRTAAEKALATQLGVDPALAKAATQLRQRVGSETDNMIAKAKAFGQGIPLALFPVDGGRITRDESTGTLTIAGQPVAVSPEGTVDVSSLTAVQKAAWDDAITKQRLDNGAGRKVTSTHPDLPPGGDSDGGKIARQMAGGSAMKPLGLTDPKSRDAKISAAIAQATAAASAAPESMRQRIFEGYLRSALEAAGLSWADYVTAK